MTVIERTDDAITCTDHAGNTIACAMLTALTVSLTENLTIRLNLPIPFALTSGSYIINTCSVSDAIAQQLIESYWFSLKNLATSYPDNFTIRDKRSSL